MDSTTEDVLKKLKSRLVAVYGRRLIRLMLFGSRARGDFEPDSDVDVAIVLEGPFEYWEELKRSSETVAELCLEEDVVISRILLTREEAEKSRHPVAAAIRREGLAV